MFEIKQLIPLNLTLRLFSLSLFHISKMPESLLLSDSDFLVKVILAAPLHFSNYIVYEVHSNPWIFLQFNFELTNLDIILYYHICSQLLNSYLNLTRNIHFIFLPSIFCISFPNHFKKLLHFILHYYSSFCHQGAFQWHILSSCQSKTFEALCASKLSWNILNTLCCSLLFPYIFERI